MGDGGDGEGGRGEGAAGGVGGGVEHLEDPKPRGSLVGPGGCLTPSSGGRPRVLWVSRRGWRRVASDFTQPGSDVLD